MTCLQTLKGFLFATIWTHPCGVSATVMRNRQFISSICLNLFFSNAFCFSFSTCGNWKILLKMGRKCYITRHYFFFSNDKLLNLFLFKLIHLYLIAQTAKDHSVVPNELFNKMNLFTTRSANWWTLNL